MKIDYPKGLSKLRELREKHNMSLSDLARKVDTSKSYISHVERGEMNCSIQMERAIAGVFKVKLDELL